MPQLRVVFDIRELGGNHPKTRMKASLTPSHHPAETEMPKKELQSLKDIGRKNRVWDHFITV